MTKLGWTVQARTPDELRQALLVWHARQIDRHNESTLRATTQKASAVSGAMAHAHADAMAFLRDLTIDTGVPNKS